MTRAHPVVFELPSLLASLVDTRTVEVLARTVREALDCLCHDYPTLRVHLFDESGTFRQHVLCFHNRTNTRWSGTLDIPLSPGDRLTILQAVSGG